jgi:hypothetical protein
LWFWVACGSGFPAAFAIASLMLALILIFFYRGGAGALVFLLHLLPRVFRLALLFIFIDPCAGRHSLSLLTFFGAAKKVSAAPPRVNENKK